MNNALLFRQTADTLNDVIPRFFFLCVLAFANLQVSLFLFFSPVSPYLLKGNSMRGSEKGNGLIDRTIKVSQ